MEKLKYENFDEAYALFENAFVPAELRCYNQMKELFLQNKFVIYEYRKDIQLIGAMIVWEFNECIYLENFAVASSMRNQGIGSFFMKQIKDMYPNHLIVLEVEEPVDSLSTRRVDFYQRHHFKLNPFHYIQPALRENADKVHLMLMSYPDCMHNEKYQHIKKILFKEVYNQEV